MLRPFSLYVAPKSDIGAKVVQLENRRQSNKSIFEGILIMASITKRGDFWRAQVRARGEQSLSRTFDTKAQAEAWARDVRAQMDRGLFRSLGEAEKTTLGEALERYYREISRKKGHPPKDRQRVNHWQRHPLAHRFLATLRGADFASYRDARRTAGRAESTIRLELQIVSHLFEIARKEWGMEGLPNPLKNIRKPSGSAERDRRLRPNEFEALLTQLRRSANPWAAPAFELAIETSLRQGMLFKLERAWLDDSGRVFHIPQHCRGSGNKVVPPFLPLSTRAATIVAGLPRSIDGKLIGCTQNAVVVVWKRAVAAARTLHIEQALERGESPVAGFLEGLRWHDLRHEAASRLFEKGLHPLEVAAITGHKSLTMLRRYTHLQPNQLLAKLG